MSDPVLELLARSPGGGGLVVRWTRCDDRYAHTIGLFCGDTMLSLLAAEDGTGSEAWPPAPPLQQLVLEPRSGGPPVALAVGQAGRSHWSLCATAAADGAALEFDVACRPARPRVPADALAPPPFLGSTYRILAGTVRQSDACHVELQSALGRLDLECAPQCSATGGHLELRPDQLQIVPAATTAATVRWSYRLRAELSTHP